MVSGDRSTKLRAHGSLTLWIYLWSVVRDRPHFSSDPSYSTDIILRELLQTYRSIIYDTRIFVSLGIRYISYRSTGLQLVPIVFELCQPITQKLGDENVTRYLFFFFSHTFTFQLLDKPWSQVSSFLHPPGSCLQFLLRIGFSNPTARRFFIECC